MHKGFLILLFLALLQALPVMGQTANTPIRLFMPDGQLRSNFIRVFVTSELSQEMQPTLELLHIHHFSPADQAAPRFPARVVSPHQVWPGDTSATGSLGTFLLFDLSAFGIPRYMARIKVIPVLRWHDQQSGSVCAVHTGEVYLANRSGAVLWTLSAIGVLLIIITLISSGKGASVIDLFTGVDNHLSLWRTQLAAWTVAVGSIVLGYAMIRLEVPEIPESVVSLMGLSLATGGYSHYKTMLSVHQAGIRPRDRSQPRRLFDLIADFPTGQTQGSLSIAKVQMLFWTVLIIIIFLCKSIIEGVLWDVPWMMVVLMGMSQAGYLGPKVMRPLPDTDSVVPQAGGQSPGA